MTDAAELLLDTAPAAPGAPTAGHPAVGAGDADDPPAAAMLTPYLAWSTFAGALNAEIVRRNPT